LVGMDRKENSIASSIKEMVKPLTPIRRKKMSENQRENGGGLEFSVSWRRFGLKTKAKGIGPGEEKEEYQSYTHQQLYSREH